MCPLQNHILQEPSGEVMGTSAVLPVKEILSEKGDLKNFLGNYPKPINISFTVFLPLQFSESLGDSICQSRISRFRSMKRVRKAKRGKHIQLLGWIR